MALQKQVVRMSVEGSLDTKTDDKNVLATNFLELENVRFTKTGAFTKRNGYAAYTNNVLGSVAPISSGSALTVLKDELLRYSSDKLYSYSSAENSWVDRGNTQFVLNEEFSVANNGSQLTEATFAISNGVACYLYKGTSTLASTSAIYKIVDNTTGAILSTGTAETSISKPYVVALGTKFYIFYIFGGSLRFKTIDYTTPSTISTATTVATASYYDVQVIGSFIYVAYNNAAGGILVRRIDSSGTVSSATSVSDAITDYSTFSICSHGSNIRITYSNSTTSSTTKSVLLSADLLTVVHSAVVVVADNTENIISIQDPLDATKCNIYPYNPSTSELRKYTITAAGAVVDTGVLYYQAIPYSKAQVYNSKVYFVIMRRNATIDSGYGVAAAAQTSPSVPYDTPFRTLFLMSESVGFLSRVAVDLGYYNDPATYTAPTPLYLDGTKLQFTHPEAADVYTPFPTITITVATTVRRYSFDFNANNNYFDTTLADTLHISGGILKMYDGQDLVEHGFLLTPEPPKIVSDTVTGGILQDGTYQYCVVYKWVDRYGQIHRSAPSFPTTYVVSGGPKRPTIQLYYLPFTNKSNVEIELYRTEMNGTIFYKQAAAFGDRVINSTSSIFINVIDTTDDDTLISNETLYTNGGVLENTAAMPSKFAVTYKNRVFLIGSDGLSLQYSKARELNSPVEFAAEFRIILEATGGPATALGVMDDNLIIFKERSIMVMSGEGPNSLGEQDDFRVPQTVTADVGCIDANSVVSSPIGLLFKSEKGIYLLSRNLAVQYIGAPVEGFNSDTVTSAVLLANTNEIRMTLNQDKAIVYDYFHQKWSTDTNINAVDSVVFNNIHTLIRADGTVLYETPNVFSDNGDYISMKLTSSWIQVAGIQGFERFYKMMVLGSYKSAHLLNAKFTYNFNPNWVHTLQVNTNTVFTGDPYELYQFEFRPKIQKCEAFKFQLYDEELSGVGEGLELSNFAAEIGLKSNLFKKSDAKSFGAS